MHKAVFKGIRKEAWNIIIIIILRSEKLDLQATKSLQLCQQLVQRQSAFHSAAKIAHVTVVTNAN